MSRPRPRPRAVVRRTAAALLAALCLGLAAPPVGGEPGNPGPVVPGADARGVFTLVKQAFETGDEQALADLVHADGLRVRRGNAARDTEYSPSQSFYFFRNLFQTHRTVAFDFLRVEEAAAGERVHAMVQWAFRRQGEAEPREVRLVFVLSRQGPDWRLTELTTIG